MSSEHIELFKLFDIIIHQILFINNIYVKESFESFHKGNLQTWKCVHPDVSEYIYKFLSVAQEYFEKCQPIQIVCELRKYPDTVVDEYVFHVKPKQLKISRSEFDKMVTDTIQSLQVVALDNNSISDNEELSFTLLIRKEEPDIQFPVIDENSCVVFVKSSEDDCPKIIPSKRIKYS